MLKFKRKLKIFLSDDKKSFCEIENRRDTPLGEDPLRIRVVFEVEPTVILNIPKCIKSFRFFTDVDPEVILKGIYEISMADLDAFEKSRKSK
jgi:hypothetical protein